MSLDELRTAKVLYDSAYHPDSGERMNLIGRMSFQVPGGMVILGSMLVYYRYDVHDYSHNPHNLIYVIYNLCNKI